MSPLHTRVSKSRFGRRDRGSCAGAEDPPPGPPKRDPVIRLQVLPRDGFPDPEGERLSRLCGASVRAGWIFTLPVAEEALSGAAAVLGDPVGDEFWVGEDVPEPWACALEVPDDAPARAAELLLGVAPVCAARLYLADSAEALAPWLGRACLVRDAAGAVREIPGPTAHGPSAPAAVSLPLGEGLAVTATLVELPLAGDPPLAAVLRDLLPAEAGFAVLMPGDSAPVQELAIRALEVQGHRLGLPFVAAALRPGTAPRLLVGALRVGPGDAPVPDRPGPVLRFAEPPLPADEEEFLRRLADFRSRESFLGRLDAEGLGNAVVRPLNPRRGPSDGAVVWPLELQAAGSPLGVAVAVGVGATPAEAEAEARNGAVACGGDPGRTAVLPWAAWDAAAAVALAPVPDVRVPVGIEPQRPGDRVLLLDGAPGRLHAAMADVASCHDVSHGGLPVALAEMVASSGLGVRVTQPGPATWVLTAPPEAARRLVESTGAVDVGDVTVSGRVDLGALNVPVARLREALYR